MHNSPDLRLRNENDISEAAFCMPLKSKVYKHRQHSGDLDRGQFENVDDHHSPVQPDLYIEYRMLERMAWYQKRIPRYTFHSFAFKVLLLTCAWVKTADVFWH